MLNKAVIYVMIFRFSMIMKYSNDKHTHLPHKGGRSKFKFNT